MCHSSSRSSSSSAAKTTLSSSAPICESCSTRLRSNQSMATPAKIPNANCGSVLATITAASWSGDPVSSKIRKGRAICSIHSAVEWLMTPSQSRR